MVTLVRTSRCVPIHWTVLVFANTITRVLGLIKVGLGDVCVLLRDFSAYAGRPISIPPSSAVPSSPSTAWRMGLRSAPRGRFYFVYAVFRVRVLRVQVAMSTHKACMFGAVASVHAWERLGAAI